MARTALAFCAILSCAMLIRAAATVFHGTAVPTGNFPIYTYQNPFNATGAASIGSPQTTAAGVFAGLSTVGWGRMGKAFIWGLLGFSAIWFLDGGRTKPQRVRQTRKIATNKPLPVAVLKQDIRGLKQDTLNPAVFSRTALTASLRSPDCRRIHDPCRPRTQLARLNPRRTGRRHLN